LGSQYTGDTNELAAFLCAFSSVSILQTSLVSASTVVLPFLKKGGKSGRPGCAEKQAGVLEKNRFLAALQKAILTSEMVKCVPPDLQPETLCNLGVLCWLVIMVRSCIWTVGYVSIRCRSRCFHRHLCTQEFSFTNGSKQPGRVRQPYIWFLRAWASSAVL